MRWPLRRTRIRLDRAREQRGGAVIRTGGGPDCMQDACRYADRPFAFLARYVKVRPVAHAAIVIAVVVAVGCSVGAQFGVKILVDTLAGVCVPKTPSVLIT